MLHTRAEFRMAGGKGTDMRLAGFFSLFSLSVCLGLDAATIDPSREGAAAELAAALARGEKQIKIKDGVVEGAFLVASDCTISGVPGEKGEVAVRGTTAGRPVFQLKDGAALSLSSISLKAAPGLRGVDGVSAGKGSTLKIRNCRFEGGLSSGIAAEESVVEAGASAFNRIEGDGIKASGGSVTAGDCRFESLKGAALRTENSTVTAESLMVSYADGGGVTAKGGTVVAVSGKFENCSPSAVHVEKAVEASIRDCEVKFTTKDALVVLDCAEALVEGNLVEGVKASAIWVRGKAVVRNNTFRSDDNGVGVRVQGSGTVISENTLDHLKVGVGARETSSLLASENRIRWSWAGIYAIDCDSSTIRNNTLQTVSEKGIVFSNCTGSVAQENTVESCGIGLIVEAGAAVVSNNAFKGNTTGIHCRSGAGTEVKENEFTGDKSTAMNMRESTISVHDNTVDSLRCAFYDCHNAAVFNNTFKSTVFSSHPYFSGCNGVQIYGNDFHCTGDHGVCVHWSPGAHIHDNKFHGAADRGLHVNEGWDYHIYRNEFYDTGGFGAYIEHNKGVKFYENVLHDAVQGLRFDDVVGEFYDNTFENLKHSAVVLWEDVSAEGHHNTAHHCHTGILCRSSHGTFHHNHFHHNDYGLYLKSSRGKKIIAYRNDLHDNLRTGIRIEWSADCEIYENRIVDNVRHGIRIRPKCPVFAHHNYIARNERFGVWAWDDNEVRLSGNLIVENGYCGVASGSNKSFSAAGNTVIDNSLGGFWSYDGGTVVIEKNVIYRNNGPAVDTSPQGKEGEGVKGEGNAVISGNIIFSNSVDTGFERTEDDGTNIVQDPLLTDPGNGVYTPMRGSPALENGLIGAVPADGNTPVPTEPILEAGCRVRDPAEQEDTPGEQQQTPEEPMTLF